MYSKEQKDIALRIYHQTESVTETIRILGYPTRRNLYTWIAEENTPPKTRKEYPVIDNPPDHPRNPPLEVKLDAIHRCYKLGENIKYVSEDIGYSRASIYQWRKRYLKEGTLGLMNHKNITPGTLVEGSVSSTDISSDEINQLKAQMQDMQLEIDILKETINVLKKDPDIDQSALSNREKAVIIDVLKNRYSLPLLLQKLQLSKSSYYYQEQSLQKEDKYTLLRVRVIELFTENKGRYGYRRIHALLKRENIIVSEKVIRRIMKEEQLVVKILGNALPSFLLPLVRKLVYKFIKFITSLIIISFSSGFDSAIINVMATNVPSLNRLALFKNKTLFLSKNSKKRDAAIL